MALFGLRKKELADKQPKPEMDKEVGVAGQLVFTGIDNEEKRTDNITIEKYRKMVDTDDVAQAMYLILSLPILRSTYKIVSDKDDTGETQANLIRDNLLSPPHKGGIETPLDLVLAQMLLATIDGFTLFNRVLTVNKNGNIVYKKLAHRDSIGLTLKRDEYGGYAGAHQQVNYNGKLVDVHFNPEETFLFTYDKARNYLYGRSAFTTAYVNYDRKRRLEYLDGIGLQNDAIKAKILRRTESGSLGVVGRKAKNLALAALAKLGELKPVAAIPYGWEVKELNSEGRDPGPSIERQNAGMARSVLAQFIMLGTQGKSNVGSYALSENHSDLFMIALKGLMQNIENHINFYLIPELIDLNFAEAHYPEFHFDDLTSDVRSIMRDAFLKLIEKDKITDELVRGILDDVASMLGINIEKIRKDLEKERKKAEKDKPQPPTTSEPPAPQPVQPAIPTQPANPKLSDVSVHDFPGLYEEMGINQDNLGCIMLDLQPFDVRKYVPGADADLYSDSANPDVHSQGAIAETEAHVTLLFGLLQNGNDIKDQVDKVLNGWKCDSVVIDNVDSFPVPADAPAVPIIARIWSNSLEEGHERLTLLPHVNTYGNYSPHITLAWVKNDPDIVQRWVKALSPALQGIRIAAAGINYGDVQGGSAVSGGKFRQPQLSDSEEWFRPLTLAEQQVDFSVMQRKMNSFEKQFLDDIKPLYDQIKDEAIKTLTPLLESKDIAALNNIQLKHTTEYRDVIAKAMKSAYEFAKTGAADELKLPSPATKRETTAIINQNAQSVVDKQFGDLVFTIRNEIIKDLRKNNLADHELSIADVITAVATAFDAFFDSKISLTGAIVVSQAVNMARDAVFSTHPNQIACYQYSAILDHKTCPTCRALDGCVVDYAGYRATIWKCPIHGWCRCIWVAIKKDQQEIPDITGLPDKPGGVDAPLL